MRERERERVEKKRVQNRIRKLQKGARQAQAYLHRLVYLFIYFFFSNECIE